MKSKHIILIVALVLVLAAGITVICVGCNQNKNPEGGAANGTAQAPGNQNGTGTADPSNPANEGTLPGGFELIDREELDDDTGTTPTTNPTNPTTPTTKPTNPTTPAPGTDGPELDENGYWTYEYYISRSGEEQMAYYRTFPSMAEFNKWYNAAKAEYDRKHPKETIGPDGKIELN